MRKILPFFLLVCVAAGLQAQELVQIPELTRQVTDTTGTLSDSDVATLEQKLTEFEKKKGSQIAVLIVPSVKPEAIEQFGIRVAEKWKIGRKKVDDGAILIIAKNDRRLRIEVGYGLEGALNDAVCKRIIDEQIVPLFKAKDYSGGVTAGVDAMIAIIQGEPLPEATGEVGGGHSARFDHGVMGGKSPSVGGAFVGLLILGSILASLVNRFVAGLISLSVGVVLGFLFFGLALGAILGVVAMLAVWFFGGGTGGSWGSSGGSWGGSSGGSSWGGGGGSFGGGGSSGSW